MQKIVSRTNAAYILSKRFQSSALPKTLKKFWKKVEVDELSSLGRDQLQKAVVLRPQATNNYVIRLDSRPLRTPDSQIIVAPSRVLAEIVAHEWDAQDEDHLKSSSLMATSLLTRAIEFQTDANVRSQTLKFLQRYIDTDSILYQQDTSTQIIELQEQLWLPIIDTVQEQLKINLKTTNGLSSITQDRHAIQRLLTIVDQYDALKLASFEKAVMNSKSWLIAMALSDLDLSVEKAVQAARLETIHQTMMWGEVEDTHDVEIEDLTRTLGLCKLHELQ
ncbi:hypothetical protein MP228_009726 [Amoeboaphelidium protococcarum]|nr:hypothetical protein MP228_009726 [Amoeboaphelidium protococcarum]